MTHLSQHSTMMGLIMTIYTQTLATSLCMERFSLCRDCKDKIWDQMNLCNGSLVSQLPRKYWLAHMNTTHIIMKNLPPNYVWRYDIEIMGFGTYMYVTHAWLSMPPSPQWINYSNHILYFKCQQTIRCEHRQTCSLKPSYIINIAKRFVSFVKCKH